jgi:hypothetical protein
MGKLMFVGGALAMLLGSGCSHYVASKGEAINQAKANEARARGDYGKAEEYQRKADRDAARAAGAVIP